MCARPALIGSIWVAPPCVRQATLRHAANACFTTPPEDKKKTRDVLVARWVWLVLLFVMLFVRHLTRPLTPWMIKLRNLAPHRHARLSLFYASVLIFDSCSTAAVGCLPFPYFVCSSWFMLFVVLYGRLPVPWDACGLL